MHSSVEIDEMLLGVLPVFFRYGYKKTSLDDVANAVNVSRQTLYQRYKNKETLFRLSVEATFANSIKQCRRVLSEETLPLEEKIFRIFDVSCGQYVEVFKTSAHANELMDITHSLVGDFVREQQENFVEIVAQILDEASSKQNADSKKIAETLYYTSKGILQLCDSHDDY